MEWQAVKGGYILRGARYGARLVMEKTPFFRFVLDGVHFGEFPAVSVFDRVDEKEKLSDITILSMDTSGEALTVTFQAKSSLWTAHTFVWTFEKKRAQYYHVIEGSGKLGRCFFFSTGIPHVYDDGDSAGYQTNARIDAEYYTTPAVNLGNVEEFRNASSASTGLGGGENPVREQFLPERSHGLFAPSPLFFCFYDEESAMGLGLGTEPGNYRFSAFEYSGELKRGASFHVQYFGYTEANGSYRSPVVSFTFASAPMDALERHVEWLDEKGYSTSFGLEKTPDWHRAPIFCGWAEQTVRAYHRGTKDGSEATQANYEEWVETLEKRGIPFSTIVIDDKWQKYYGTFEVDTEKWPDMQGFIRRQHEKGRHVVLWTASYHTEGLPQELCICDEEGKKLFADVTNPDYEKLIRGQINHLLSEVGADGFKEDWIGSCVNRPGVPGYGKLHGMEMVRRFQYILWDASHKAKPDALVETQTPNPLFRESSDVLRLNDLWFSTRHVCDTMRNRARISRICGWRVLDCDNASCTTVDQWFQYMQYQVKLGTPALYCVSSTESFYETIPEGMWAYLKVLWEKYNEENV